MSRVAGDSGKEDTSNLNANALDGKSFVANMQKTNRVDSDVRLLAPGAFGSLLRLRFRGSLSRRRTARQEFGWVAISRITACRLAGIESKPTKTGLWMDRTGPGSVAPRLEFRREAGE